MIAALSPLLGGVAWTALMLAAVKVQYDRTPDDDLGPAIAFVAIAVIGLVGLAALLIPLVIGLTNKSPSTRLAAAWVGCAICALGALLWAKAAVPHVPRGPDDVLACLSVVALLAPSLVTAVVTRRELRAPDPEPV